MNFNKLLMIPLLAAFPLVVGCGNDCKSTCEDANECAGRTTKEDCDSECDKADKLADDSDCGDQYDDYTSCLADQDDICKISLTTCQTEAAALYTCAAPYCMKQENAKQCADSGIGSTDDGT